MKTGPFKLRSGNKPSIAKLSGISPAKQTLPTKTAGQFTTKSERAKIKKQKGNLSSKTEFRSFVDKTPTGRVINTISNAAKNTYKNLDIKGNINKAVDYFTKK